MVNSTRILTGARIVGGLLFLTGIINLILSPVIGESVSADLWSVEPLTYIGAILVIAGLSVTSLSHMLPRVVAKMGHRPIETETVRRWSQITQQYFELFHHDLGRPLRRIVGKERELRTILRSSGTEIDEATEELFDEIERQAPNFRLMMSNIQNLIELESPTAQPGLQAIEPSEVVRKVVDRYTSVPAASPKEVTWWAEPAEFGIVYAEGMAIEHIVTNLVDNAVRFASRQVEVKLTKNPSHFFIRVWDDGPGIAPHYLQHIFDRGWTPEVARGEERSSSGLGLFIARTLAHRFGGELTVESVAGPSPDHHTAFLLSFPLR